MVPCPGLHLALTQDFQSSGLWRWGARLGPILHYHPFARVGRALPGIAVHL